ncbi:gliding motility lipoprotein GldB [Bergeyella sp. RCAD1439]|uniref:gliding motility lipoprotein GldB n=1 Tax=Bergeyella anatis TaxID=3113737 RepID=UPI002E1872E8|nr:gliding motility protein GldB [Bergeyella sp. RCAD1439]
MKFFRFWPFWAFLMLGSLSSCQKETPNPWEHPVQVTEKTNITDLSKSFYDPTYPLDTFKAKYPWFQGSVSDEDFVQRRKDPEEIKIYQTAVKKIDQGKLENDLNQLFSRVKHYFPQFAPPKVYLFSSALQMAKDPVFFIPSENLLFIDITGFLGENAPEYQGMENYFKKSMNPNNLLPKVAATIAENFVKYDNTKFIDQLVSNGKIMILQDAFLPETQDHLKIGYSLPQYEWAKANESNIWNYFVENNLLFSDDQRLAERFIAPGPFSKFYTEIDNESSPQIGIFTGWQIARTYYKKHPETPLQEFLKMDNQTLFNQAVYKP